MAISTLLPSGVKGSLPDSSRKLIGVGTANQQFNYSYDLAANRYDVKTYAGAFLQSESYYTVNHLNQLDTVSVNGGTPVPLHYDGDGNLTDDASRDQIKGLLEALVKFSRRPAK